MFFGKSYHVELQRWVVSVFTCPKCHEEQYASVLGTGRGEGMSPYFLANEQAASDARRKAKREMDADRRLALSMAKCPLCGHRDEDAVLSAKRGPALLIALALSASAGLVYFYLVVDPHLFGVALFGALGPIGSWFIWRQARSSWETVDDRVHFLSEDEVAKYHRRQNRKRRAARAELESEERELRHADKRRRKRRKNRVRR